MINDKILILGWSNPLICYIYNCVVLPHSSLCTENAVSCAMSPYFLHDFSVSLSGTRGLTSSHPSHLLPSCLKSSRGEVELHRACRKRWSFSFLVYYHLNQNFIHVVPITHELLAVLAWEILFLLLNLLDCALCHMQEQNFMETAIVMKWLQENDVFVDSQAELVLSKFIDAIKSFPSSIKAGKHLRKYTHTHKHPKTGHREVQLT